MTMSPTPLESRSMFPRKNTGRVGTITDDSHARPYIDGVYKAVPAGGHKYDAFTDSGPCPVDGPLDRRRIIGYPVAVYIELRCRQVHGLGIIHACGELRCGEDCRSKRKEQGCGQQFRSHL